LFTLPVSLCSLTFSVTQSRVANYEQMYLVDGYLISFEVVIIGPLFAHLITLGFSDDP